MCKLVTTYLKRMLKNAYYNSRENTKRLFSYSSDYNNNDQDQPKQKNRWVDFFIWTMMMATYTIAFGFLFYRYSSIKNSTITINHENGCSIDNTFVSNWFSLYDISQTKMLVLFDDQYQRHLFYRVKMLDSINCKTSFSYLFDDNYCVTVDLGLLTEFSLFSIEPDEITHTSIIYKDRGKINQIHVQGVSFYAKFPEQQGKQATRVLILTILFAMLLPVLLKRLLCEVFTIYMIPSFLVLDSVEFLKSKIIDLIHQKDHMNAPVEESNGIEASTNPIKNTPPDNH